MKNIESLRECDAIVEATDEEYMGLWVRWAHDSPWHRTTTDRRRTWHQQPVGWWREIGQVAGRPICISVLFATIDGKSIAFVDGTSELVDHKMIREWIRQEAGLEDRSIPIVNATNFHNAF